MKLTGSRCQCAACGEVFNSVTIFDRHRREIYAAAGRLRHCLTPAAMAARGWSRNASGFWIIETRSQRAARALAGGVRAAIDAQGPAQHALPVPRPARPEAT